MDNVIGGIKKKEKRGEEEEKGRRRDLDIDN